MIERPTLGWAIADPIAPMASAVTRSLFIDASEEGWSGQNASPVCTVYPNPAPMATSDGFRVLQTEEGETH